MASRWLGVLALAASLHCTLWYADLPVGQCSTDADCAAIDPQLPSCDPALQMCVAAPTTLVVNAAPVEVCDVPDTVSAAACPSLGCDAALFSQDCTCLGGSLDPEALVIGVLSPQTFATQSGGTLQIPYVERAQKAIALALDEWTRELPGGRLPHSERPLAVLYCNSNNDLVRARRAMDHLTDVVGAPLVITLNDGDTEAIRFQAQRANRAVLCTTCFAEPAADEGALIWRVAPPLAAQSALIEARAVELASAPSDPTEPRRIVVLSQDYAGINQLAGEVMSALAVRGGYQLVPIQTGNPLVERVVQLDVAQSVIAARPEVVVVAMDSDFTTYYLRLIESNWPADEARPNYVVSYLNQELALLSSIVGDDDDLRARISGAGWGPDARVEHNLSSLEERFALRHQQRVDQTQFGYDAFYAAAYALIGASRARLALDGSSVALGLEHLLAGTPVDVGPDSIKSALAELLSGKDIDLVGSSSQLDWQLPRHIPRSDVSAWCLTRNGDGSLDLLTSAGPVWSAETGEISGRHVCP